MRWAAVAAFAVACGGEPDPMGLVADVIPANAQPVFLGAVQQSNGAEQCETATDLAPGDAYLANAITHSKYCRRVYNGEADVTGSNTAWSDYQAISGRIGWEMSFADEMGAGVHLAKFARGASDSVWWIANDQIDEVISWFAAQRALLPFPTYPAGAIWCQGESDVIEGLVSGWATRADTMRTALRAGVGRRALPIFVVQTQLGAPIQAEQAAFAASDPYARTFVVDLTDVPYDVSPHWTTSVPEIGRRLATAVTPYLL